MSANDEEQDVVEEEPIGRILHIGNVAGVPQILAKTQRNLGFNSNAMSFERHPFEYESDILCEIRHGYPLNLIEKMMCVLSEMRPYDVLHFHVDTVLPKMIDTVLWKAAGRRVVIHHHGSELRTTRPRIRPYRFAIGTIVSTPDLLKWCPGASWIPNPITLEDYPCVGVRDGDESEVVKIVHAPSSRAKKGTRIIENAVQKLRDDGYSAQLVVVENTPHRDAVRIYRDADIVVDQLVVGWYGMFAAECMALGKPVCCHIANDVLGYMKSDAIINVDANNLSTKLAELIRNRDIMRTRGMMCRDYVEKMHDSYTVAKKVSRIYLGDASVDS